MAWTTDDLAKLENAIKTGVSEVEYSTGKVVYRSLSQMLELRTLMKRELGMTSGVGSRTTAKTGKGL